MKIFLSPRSSVNAYDEIQENRVSIDIIAGNLSRICRFAGACGKFYSVAEHSILVSALFADPKLKKAALLHDAHEAFTGDIIRPIREVIHHSEDLIVLQARLDRVINSAFRLRLDDDEKKAIKLADDMLLQIECAIFFNYTTAESIVYRETVEKVRNSIQCYSPETAYGAFLDHWKALQDV